MSEFPRPPKIVEMMKSRGEQDEAKPTLKIVEPKADTTLASSTVEVKLELVDKNGKRVENGDYNSVEREIMITK